MLKQTFNHIKSFVFFFSCPSLDPHFPQYNSIVGKMGVMTNFFSMNESFNFAIEMNYIHAF